MITVIPPLVSSSLTRAALHTIAAAQPGQSVSVVFDEGCVRLANSHDPESSVSAYELGAEEISAAQQMENEDINSAE